MVKCLRVILFSVSVVLAAGCGSRRTKPIWEQVKIGDLAPTGAADPDRRRLKTINMTMYIFEMPAENADTLKDVWKLLHREPLKFNNFDTFKANSFSAGFGQLAMWNEIGELLNDGGAKELETVSILLSDGRSDYPTIARLYRKQSIFYASEINSAEIASVGRGELALAINAERIPGIRGVCNVEMHPVFLPAKLSIIPQLADKQKSRRISFKSVGFALKMSPGEFVLLGPDKNIDNQITLAGFFFSRSTPEPVIRFYVILCAMISD